MMQLTAGWEFYKQRRQEAVNFGCCLIDAAAWGVHECTAHTSQPNQQPLCHRNWPVHQHVTAKTQHQVCWLLEHPVQLLQAMLGNEQCRKQDIDIQLVFLLPFARRLRVVNVC